MRMDYFVLEAWFVKQLDKYLQWKSALLSYLKLVAFLPNLFVTFMNEPIIKEYFLRQDMFAPENIGSLAQNDWFLSYTNVWLVSD